MGNAGARQLGLEKAFTEIGDCIAGLVSIIDKATRAETSGRVNGWDGSSWPW